MNKKEFIIYLAGLFDGEGSVKYYNSSKKYVCVSQSGRRGKEICEMIKNRINLGNVYSSQKGRIKIMNWWQTRKLDQMISFLELINPYLLIKKNEVSNVLKILKTSSRWQSQWSIKEDEFLIKMKDSPIKRTSKFLGRTYKAVAHRRHKLGLPRYGNN